jgi:hypothetical protein
MARVKSPRPSGLYATKPTPSSRQVGRIASSTSRVKIEYSLCTALIGNTAQARRSVAAEHSESPRKRTLPASTNPAMAPTVSSIGVSGSTRC